MKFAGKYHIKKVFEGKVLCRNVAQAKGNDGRTLQDVPE